MERAEADALIAGLARLPKFPIPLSELETHLGRPLRRHFNPESHDPTFVHDEGGEGVNIGGTPVFHPSLEPKVGLVVELRSQHYARYDDARKFDVRFFDVDLPDGPHAGEFLRQEGVSRALYIDFNVQGDARVPLPRFFGALGFTKATVDPSQVPEIAPGHQDGGLLYYDDVTVERDGWSVRATGFYPVAKGGKPASTVDLERFLVQSPTIRHQVRG